MRSLAVFVLSLSIASLVPFLPMDRAGRCGMAFPGWPAEYQIPAVKELALDNKEERFAAGFPGRMGRFRDGKREIVVRWLCRATRKLHPAADCYKGWGYTIRYEPIIVDRDGRRWGVFTASKGATRFLVKERIHDGQGNGWTDVSSWYWSALLGNSEGPWWAVTVAERVACQERAPRPDEGAGGTGGDAVNAMQDLEML